MNTVERIVDLATSMVYRSGRDNASPFIKGVISKISTNKSLNQCAPIVDFFSVLCDFSDHDCHNFWDSLTRERYLSDEFYQESAYRHLGVRFLRPQTFPTRVGELAKDVDVLVKLGVLGWRQPFKPVLPWFSNHGFGNPHFFKTYICPHIQLTQSPEILSYVKNNPGEAYCTAHAMTSAGVSMFTDYSVHDVQAEWERRALPPVFSLHPDDEDRGGLLLRKLGLPEDAWWVTLHARSDGYHSDQNNCRSVDIATYLPAIKEITRRGGWVFRLGDRSMPRLSEMAQVIDYAHAPFRQGWLDVYLCARARFAITCTSGMHVLHQIFGTPQIQTNMQPFFNRPYSRHDIFLPMHLRDHETGDLVSYAPINQTLISISPYHCESAGVTLERNSPEDIHEAVLEMFDRLNGSYSEDDTTKALKRSFDQIALEKFPAVNSHLSAAFANKYGDLFAYRPHPRLSLIPPFPTRGC